MNCSSPNHRREGVETRRTDPATDGQGHAVPVVGEKPAQLDLFEPMTIWEFAVTLANAPKLCDLPVKGGQL
jgi:hypothetical protein